MIQWEPKNFVIGRKHWAAKIATRKMCGKNSFHLEPPAFDVYLIETDKTTNRQ